ncbi:MAG: glycosyltransferase [Candidatus Aegiribacteria sp.]|nr:glycosyltransferase [Candidatus Aegiribacteria sp.]
MDLSTNLQKEDEVNNKNKLLVLAPQSPPYGGVADQSSLLIFSKPFIKKFDVTAIRTNPIRSIEIPSVAKKGSLKHVNSLLRSTMAELRSQEYSAIQLVTNGDISFIRDMLVAIIAKTKYKLPLAVHLHASRMGFWHSRTVHSVGTRQSVPDGIMGRLGYKLCSFLISHVDSFSQLTEQIDEFYLTKGFRKADAILPNAVANRTKVFEKGDPTSILFVGRLTEEKGIFDLVNSLALMENKNWSLNILGDFSIEEDRLKMDTALAEHPWRQNIHFHGIVSGEEKWNYYRNASIFILPSYVEVFPVVILEAMAFGCAVISTEVGEIASIIIDPASCLVKPGEIFAIKEAISALIANPSKCFEFGAQNYLHVKKYELDTVASSFVRQLLNIIGNTV